MPQHSYKQLEEAYQRGVNKEHICLIPQHSYKQLEEAYQRGVNKEHILNPARTHPMSS